MIGYLPNSVEYEIGRAKPLEYLVILGNQDCPKDLGLVYSLECAKIGDDSNTVECPPLTINPESGRL